MARAPGHSGRAPAHLTVLPGGAASGGLDDLEDDRTTIEPPPGIPPEEAPTPIAGSSGIEEQWEDGTTVAEQSGSKRNAVVEESTIEDQARPLPPLQLVPPPAVDPAAAAKLVVIAGTDQGRVFDLRAGGVVRIGRAVDNDVVLTDIAVSRKHLALQWDGGAWVVQDNGSGNGTLINDRLEDGRCQLHHGDRVEIGNTVFRLDHPPSAHQPSVAGWGQQEEEAATVAGKPPVRPSQVASAAVEVPRRSSSPQPGRPASVTAQVRERTPAPTAMGAGGAPRNGRRAPSQPPAARPRAPTAPPPPPPRATSTMSPPPVAAPAVVPPPRVLSTPTGGPAAQVTHTAHAAPSGPVVQPLSGPFTAPNVAPSMSGSYPMTYGNNLRPMTTTAQVDPRPFPSAHASWGAPPAPDRKRTFFIAAGAIALVSIVAAAALVGGGGKPTATGSGSATAGTGSGSVTVAAGTGSDSGAGAVTGSGAATGSGSGSATDSGSGSGSATGAGSATDSGSGAGSGSATGSGAASGSGSGAATGSGSGAAALAAVPPDTVGSGSATADAEEPPVPTPPTPVAPTPPNGGTRPIVKDPVRKPDRPIVRPDRTPKPRVVVSPARDVDLDDPPASSSPKAIAAAEKKAEGQYRAKEWKAAAATLREAAAGATDAEAKPLKVRAVDYETIGINLTAGSTMGTTRATEALASFSRAQAADRKAGGAHALLLRSKIAEVAPAAAASWMAKQNYEQAKNAADQAVNVGAGGSPKIDSVRKSLENKAAEFAANAQRLLKSKPEEAKSLARRITKMVPASSPSYAKAVKIINGAKAGSDDDE